MKTNCGQQVEFPSPAGCGCCAGVEPSTPLPTANRPGLAKLSCRIGTHATFLETMKARLSSSLYRELSKLASREADDPALALLDAWATVADVLTFYQEQIANEGYLRTARERRSVLELAQLVGYVLRPGVAATAYLAYTIDENTKGDVLIPKGARVQSVPDPGEFPQTFETSEECKARAEWSALKPRLSKPQYVSQTNNEDVEALYLKGTIASKANDRLLLFFGDGSGQQVPRRIQSVESQFMEGRTKVLLQSPIRVDKNPGLNKPMTLADIPSLLIKPPVLLPYNQAHLLRSISELFGQRSDVNAKLLTTYQPVLKDALPKVLKTLPVTRPLDLQNVRVMGTKAGVHGRTALLKPILDENGAMVGSEQWPLTSITLGLATKENQPVTIASVADSNGIHRGSFATTLEKQIIYLNNQYKVCYEVELDSESPPESPKEPKYVSYKFSQKEDLIETIKISHFTNNVPNPSPKNFFNVAKLTRGVASAETTTEASFFLKFEFVQSKVEAILPAKPGGRLSRMGAVGKKKYRIDITVDFNSSISIELISPANQAAKKVIALDGQYDQITPGTWVIVERHGKEEKIAKVKAVETISKTNYNLPATVTQLTLDQEWIDDDDAFLSDIRDTVVYAQSDIAELAEEPVADDISGDLLELNGVVDGLEPGRWVIVSGERTDLGGATGVKSAELAMLAGITHDVAKIPPMVGIPLPALATITCGTAATENDKDLPGDKTHTWLRLNNKLANQYKRDTVTIYANVIKATHGETRQEVLGSGDSGQALQSFTLKSAPLTHVAAPTPSGTQSTLEVRVNDILWHEAETLAGLTPNDRRYVTQTDDEGKTLVQFGNGLAGARLPTGSENVRALYRSGIGKAGNVRAAQISLLMTRPLGVKDVINPLPTSGGADQETRDSARRNVPLRVMALDRLVSVADYADFARAFAGIGKAMAVRLSDGQRELVHLTIAGADDIPIDESSDLYQNLAKGLRQFGDPAQPLLVARRELLLVLVKARVRVRPDYLWGSVEAKVRAALLDAFSFERRELGQDVLLSEVIATVQTVPGVAYVDVDELDAVNEAQLMEFLNQRVGSAKDLFSFLRQQAQQDEGIRPRPRIPVQVARLDDSPVGGVAPAQLAILTPDVEITLILEEIVA